MTVNVHPRDLLIYYDPKTEVGKKTIAYAHSMTKHVNAVEYHKTAFTATMWSELVSMLGLRPKDLLNRSHPKYQELIQGNNFGDEDWLEVLKHNPDLLIAPIAIRAGRAVLCKTPSEVLKLELNTSGIK